MNKTEAFWYTLIRLNVETLVEAFPELRKEETKDIVTSIISILKCNIETSRYFKIMGAMGEELIFYNQFADSRQPKNLTSTLLKFNVNE